MLEAQEIPAGHKRCSTCRRIVPLIDPDTGVPNFSIRKASKDGLAYSCKPCERATATKSYTSRKKKRKEKQYYQKNRDQLLKGAAERYEQNREMRQQQAADYRAAHPEVARKAGATRRLRVKRQGRIPYTREEIIERSKSPDGKTICWICMKPIESLTDLHMDHVVPLADGGSDTPDNIATAHKICNLKRPKDGRDLRQ